ncbi:MobP2 family relaxase [Enterococcus faecium]|nr:hypothetical protein [Enterococcus faecium]
MRKTPAVILTCQFTVPNSKSFSTYVDYMTREKALESIEHRTPQEEQELQTIKTTLEDFYIPEGETFSENKRKDAINESDLEAQSLIKNGVDFDKLEEQDFTQYLSYMTRYYALDQKKKLSLDEQLEYQQLDNEIKKYQNEPHEKTAGTLPGVFSVASDEVKGSDLKEIKKVFQKGQQKGSVIYQDVVSHDNLYLEKMGLYDSKTNVLDEQGLKAAGRKMMETLFEKEKLNETGYWMATIHRNTKHIHIHFAVVEKENTRRVHSEMRGDERILSPRGKRKLGTIDAMKTEYVHELERYSQEKDLMIGLEKRTLLTRKSDLRNVLTQVVKEPAQYDSYALHLLNEVYKNLPEKRSEWNYGDEKRTKLSSYTREKLDELTKYLLTNEPDYKEYIEISKSLKEEAKSLYGVSKRESKDAEKNALFDLKKRTGNAILTELKKQDSQMKALIEGMDQFQMVHNQQFRVLKQLPTKDYNYNYEEWMKRRNQFKRRIVTQRSLRQINRTINAHEEKYHAAKAYEEQQRRIQMEQERQ